MWQQPYISYPESWKKNDLLQNTEKWWIWKSLFFSPHYIWNSLSSLSSSQQSVYSLLAHELAIERCLSLPEKILEELLLAHSRQYQLLIEQILRNWSKANSGSSPSRSDDDSRWQYMTMRAGHSPILRHHTHLVEVSILKILLYPHHSSSRFSRNIPLQQSTMILSLDQIWPTIISLSLPILEYIRSIASIHTMIVIGSLLTWWERSMRDCSRCYEHDSDNESLSYSICCTSLNE